MTTHKGSIDAMVDYEMPDDIEMSLKLPKLFASVPNRDDIHTAASEIASVHMKGQKIGDLAFIEATAALDGKHTLLDANEALRPSKPTLRWEPIGEYGDDFASAAVLGHIIGRLRQVSSEDESLSMPTKTLLMSTAAVLKVRQLDNMRVVQGAARMGKAPILHTSTGVVPPAQPPGPSSFEETDDVSVKDYLEVLVNRGLWYAFIPAEVDLRKQLDNALPSGKAEDRLAGLRTELMRDIAISSDRLWGFVRTLSGLIGESAETLISTADEASMHAAKQVEAQRKMIADTVGKFQARIVETLISGLLKDSTLCNFRPGLGRQTHWWW